ncbi:MAG: ABC transporter permease [Candidatus Acidiferrales bacterium]
MRKFLASISNLFRRRRVEGDLDAEVRGYAALLEDERTRDGMNSYEAKRSARIEMGGPEQVKEEVRSARSGAWLETLSQDIRFGARTLRKNPGFTAIVVLTLALGIGANSAIFSVVDAVLLRPLPYRQPERLVTVFESKAPNDFLSRGAVSPANFLDWRVQNSVFDQIGAVMLPGYNITGTDRPERIFGANISGGMLHMVGSQPLLGREFDAADDRPGAAPVLMISQSLWQRRFGGDPQIIGKSLRMGTVSFTVVGILPADLQFPLSDLDVWVPLEQIIPPRDMQFRDAHYLDVFARLKPGVTLSQAREDMNRIAASLKQAFPNTHSGAGAVVVPLQDDLISDIRPGLLILLVAVGFVLLIACANVANLMLVRAVGRQKEMSVRLALGAGRFRLVRQMLTESLLLSVVGGAAGLLVAAWARQALLALRPVSLPLYNSIGTDSRVLLFTLALSIFTGILFGLVPALRVARSDLNLTLRAASHGMTVGAGAHRLRGVFVASEIAISLVLLIGAGLLIRSFLVLRGGSLGFRMDHIVTARVSIPPDKYTEDAQVVGFYDRLIESVRGLPAVEDAGMVSALPLAGRFSDAALDIVGRPPRAEPAMENALIRFADSQYFGVLGITVLQGRGILERDRPGASRVVVISESMARRFWPQGSPVGEHLKVYMGIDQSPWEVVGVVNDVRFSIAAEPEPTIYFPYSQNPYRFMVLTVRTHADPKTVIESIRGAAQTIDPDQPLSQIRTLDELMARVLVPWRFSMTLFGAFAALALVLAAAGIYGVISYTVGQRTNEIGIRMTLGAQARDILRMILRQGMGVVFAGIAVGLAGASYLTRFMVTQLYGVHPTDAVTFAAIPVILAVVAFAACYFPARRAMRVDPMVALRYE